MLLYCAQSCLPHRPLSLSLSSAVIKIILQVSLLRSEELNEAR